MCHVYHIEETVVRSPSPQFHNDLLVPPSKCIALELENTPPTKKEPATNGSISCHASPASTKNENRLPIPCPLPTAFSPKVEQAIGKDDIFGIKLCLLRECADFFKGICPRPSSSEYNAMAIAVCDKYPVWQDINHKDGHYWVYYYSYTYFLVLFLLF